MREGVAAESVGAEEGGGGRSTAGVEAAAVVAGVRAAAAAASTAGLLASPCKTAEMKQVFPKLIRPVIANPVRILVRNFRFHHFRFLLH